MNNHPTSICPKCGDTIANCGLKRHLATCDGISRPRNYVRKTIDWNTPNDNLFCSYCGKQCKNQNSLVQHQIRCAKNPDRRAHDILGKYSIQHLKGQTKETSEVIAKGAQHRKGRTNNNLPKSKDVIHVYQSQIRSEISKCHEFVLLNKDHIPQITQSIRSDEYAFTCTVEGHRVRNHGSNYSLVHVIIIEAVLGRKLNPGETIHHVDENKFNNDPMNLILFKTRGDHSRFHLKSTAMLVYDELNHNFECI